MQKRFTEQAKQHYHDPKRYQWLLALVIPLTAIVGPLLYSVWPSEWVLWLPFALLFTIFPLLDIAVGEDRANPPAWAVPQLAASRFYAYLIYLLVPMVWASFVFGVWWLASHPISWFGQIGLGLATGIAAAVGINVGHELGHKLERAPKLLARIALLPSLYGHFCIEHNRGHHRWVATPQDPASARMGESIWRFALREYPGGWLRSWRLEADRLQRAGCSALSGRNEVLQGLVGTALLWGGLCAWLGIVVLPFIVFVAAYASFLLTSANYIEHYGLLRRQDESGSYERPQPWHSWNSNHAVSNWAVFHLQRHSDHHAHPARPYQALRHFDGLPTLPNGYFGMYLLAWVPPLWFRVVDPLLVRTVAGDLDRINLDPQRRAALIARYDLRAGGTTANERLRDGYVAEQDLAYEI